MMNPIWATVIIIVSGIAVAILIAYFITQMIQYPTDIIDAVIIDIRFDKKIKILLNTSEYGILYFEDTYPLKYHIGEKVKIKIIFYSPDNIEVKEICKG